LVLDGDLILWGFYGAKFLAESFCLRGLLVVCVRFAAQRN
jgi:hypothetical protein